MSGSIRLSVDLSACGCGSTPPKTLTAITVSTEALCKSSPIILSLESGLKCHVPDLTTQEGLVDVMAVGNWLELGQLVDKCYYSDDLPPEELEEQRRARLNYGLFRKFFKSRYSVLVGDKLVSPFAFFRRSLVQFITSLVAYKWKAAHVAPAVPGCPPALFQREVEAMLGKQYPEVLPAYKRCSGKTSYFHWTGPDFSIHPRSPSDGLQEVENFEDFIIFEEVQEANSDEDIEDSEDTEEDRVGKGKRRQIDGKS